MQQLDFKELRFISEPYSMDENKLYVRVDDEVYHMFKLTHRKNFILILESDDIDNHDMYSVGTEINFDKSSMSPVEVDSDVFDAQRHWAYYEIGDLKDFPEYLI